MCEPGIRDSGTCQDLSSMDTCVVGEYCDYPTGFCDCEGNFMDCADECGGDAVLDECGTCDDDPSNDCVGP